MIVLDSFAPRLAGFVRDGIRRALAAHPEEQFTSAAVCCCEYMGTFFLALNSGDTDEVLMCRNAADFAVYFEELDFVEWENEFRSGNPEVQWKGKISMGDGAVFFDFIVMTLKALFKESPLPETIRWFGAELHDGTENDYWEVNRDRGQPAIANQGWPGPLVTGPGKVLFAPDGKMLLIVSAEIQLWNPAGRCREWRKKVPLRALHAHFSNSGTKLVLSEERGRTEVYSWPEFSLICEWDPPEDNLGSSPAVFSPCDQFIIQGHFTQDGEITLAVYDGVTGDQAGREKCSGGTLHDLVPAQQGKLILWAPFMRAEKNYCWYLREWPFIPGEPGQPLSVNFPDKIQNLSPSGKLAVISRFYRGQPEDIQYGLEVVTVPELEPVFTLERCGHRRVGFFDPEERILALIVKGGFEFWDMTSAKLLKEVPCEHAYGVYFSPNGEFIALHGDKVKVVRRVDLLA